MIEEASIIWQDTAAREVYSRYLELYCSQASNTRQRLSCQHEQLHNDFLLMNEAENPANEINQLSDESAILRIYVDSNLRNAHSYVDKGFNIADNALELTLKAKAMLDSI